MKARRRMGLLLVPALGAAAVLAGTWLRERSAPSPAEPAQAMPAREWQAAGIQLVGYAEDGTPRHRMTASEASGYADGTARVGSPRLELVAHDGRRWHARARTGELRNGHLILEGSVVIRRRHPVRPLELMTERLTALPARGYVETALPVRLVEPGWETRATGLRAWIDEGRMELLGRVRTRHEPDGTG